MFLNVDNIIAELERKREPIDAALTVLRDMQGQGSGRRRRRPPKSRLAPAPARKKRVLSPEARNCGIPASAAAYSLNFTVVPYGPLGYLTTWPAGQAQPFVSTLNAPTGTVVANAAIVPAGNGGDISVFATERTDLVVDIDGYFAPPGGPAVCPSIR